MDSWTKEWQAGAPSAGSADWVRSRPSVIAELMCAFPPMCLVRATRPLLCPAPGTTGIVVSYFEDGTLTVVQDPSSGVRTQCQSDWLEVVGYHSGMTPEWVRKVLGSAEPKEENENE